MYSGWLISDNSVTKLKNLFKQVHPDFIGHHITYMFGDDSIIPFEAEINVIGECITDKVQCFVVDINGNMVRPDGKVYHLTWSLNKSKGAKPVDSNQAIETNGFVHLNPIKISATPKIFKF